MITPRMTPTEREHTARAASIARTADYLSDEYVYNSKYTPPLHELCTFRDHHDAWIV